MVTIEEIRFKGLGLLGSVSLGRKAGQFIFFGSQTPVDLQTGKLTKSLRDVPADVKGRLTIGTILNDAPDDRIHAQTWRLFSNLAEILKGQGGSLEDIVHQRIFLKEMRDVPAVERVLRLFLPNGVPSTAIVGATSDGVDQDINIQADFIVLAPGSGMRKQNVSIPELDHLAAPYPLATRAGQYLFTTPLAGINLDTGKLTTRLSELTDDERKFVEPPYSADQEATVAQHMMLFRHIGKILKSQGGSFEGQVRMNGWLRIPFQEFGPLAKARRRMFSGPGLQVPATSFPMSGVRTKDALFEWQTIAILPPDGKTDHRKSINMEQHPLAQYQVAALLAGPYLLTAGEVAIDTSIPDVVRSYRDLQGDARLFSFGRVHAENPINAQSIFVYDKLKSYVEAYGLTMDRVLQQTVYIRNAADYPDVERIATLYYGAQLPPTTIVPIQGVSPFREALLEIEITAAA